MSEIIPCNASLPEISGDREVVGTSNRVVVFGSRITDADEGAAGLQRYFDANGLDFQVHWTRRPEGILDTFFGRTIEEPDAAPTIPALVISTQYMRSRDAGGYGVQVPTPQTGIAALCHEHGVTYIHMDTDDLDPEAYIQVAAELEAVLPQLPSTQEPPQLPESYHRTSIN